MPNLHGHAAKLAWVKLKLGSIIGLTLIKKQKKKVNACDICLGILNFMRATNFQDSITNPDALFALPCSQISFCEAETW